MTIATKIRRLLGTMIVYGFPRSDLEVELAIAGQLGAEVLEILPYWSSYPDPQSPPDDGSMTRAFRSTAPMDAGEVRASGRIGSTWAARHGPTWLASVDDLKRCVDWLQAAGGSCLVVHPGGLIGHRRLRQPSRGPRSRPFEPCRSRQGFRRDPLRREHASRRFPRQPDARLVATRRRARPA